MFPRWSRLAAAAPQETALRITVQAAAAESQEEQTTKQSIEAYFPEGTLRYHSRFFVQVGRPGMKPEMYLVDLAYSKCHHFSPISCHRQTYQNYKGPSQRLQNSKKHELVKKCVLYFLI